MSTSWKTSLCRGDIKVLELVAGLRSDWHIGALFSSLVRARVLALPGASRSENTDHVEKNTCWPVQILPLFEVLLLTHKLLRNSFGRQKAHFHLRMQCDDWYGCAKPPEAGVVGAADCRAAVASSPAAWGQSAWDGVALTPRPLWCEENLNCLVKRVHLAR